MKLKDESTLTWIWRSHYNEYELPDNLCRYCPRLMFAILCIPIVWPCHTANLIEKGQPSNGAPWGFGLLLNVIFMIPTILYLRFFFDGGGVLDFLYAYVSGVLSTVLLILVVVGIVLGIIHLIKMLPKRKKKKISKPYVEPEIIRIIREFFKSKREKYCPKIEWVK